MSAKVKLNVIMARKTFVVEEFVLFSSKPKTGGGPYAVEESYPLRGATRSFAGHYE